MQNATTLRWAFKWAFSRSGSGENTQVTFRVSLKTAMALKILLSEANCAKSQTQSAIWPNSGVSRMLDQRCKMP